MLIKEQEDQRTEARGTGATPPEAGKPSASSVHPSQPSDAEKLAELLDKVAALLIKKQPTAAGYEVHKIAAAIRAKDKQP